MRDLSPQSPEARRKRLASMRAAFGTEVEEKLKPRVTILEVVKRILVGVYNDGFIHAGNLAYLSILALFPFFILATAVAQLLGQGEDGAKAVATILAELPPNVADTLREPIGEVLTARTGPLLWLGALIGLWTAASFVETIRDILRRAYGVKYCAPFWEYRLGSLAFILMAVVLLMFAFAASVALSSVQHAIEAWLPFATNVIGTVEVYRIIPALALLVTFYALFFALTPSRYRRRGCRKWPGALLITVWWLGTVEILPQAMRWVGGYNLTYGSLAGVMIALLFFFIIGLGVVMGAELNAALAEAGATALKGEVYSGPYTDELEVEEPQPGEDVESELETGGPQL
ncbi:YihY/virulence factor BrkB family protein [Sphingomonas hankyongi]|uniref:YihY/virulence factor BrkB family protein n=1 Tax=Sphingomonas hankyongi TaxID=2908209 RepID=A0ABT0RZH6_9SPHN|nr:YihY/virulence factor BrkB family protein [Sphingomonas hankyongi]MCL6728992.1 YihY/virulence factor BrkB family protein [Sphingomonas hankyongi]